MDTQIIQKQLQDLMKLTDYYLFEAPPTNNSQTNIIPIYKYDYSESFSHFIPIHENFCMLLKEYPPLFKKKPFYTSVGTHTIPPVIFERCVNCSCIFDVTNEIEKITMNEVLEMINNVCVSHTQTIEINTLHFQNQYQNQIQDKIGKSVNLLKDYTRKIVHERLSET